MLATGRGLEWAGTVALVILAVCAAALTAGNVRRAFFPSPGMFTQPVDSVSNWEEFSVVGSRVGPSTAAVTIVAFSDYQCPVCRRFLTNVSLVRQMYSQDVSVVWRHLPLRSHPLAVPAARAAVCAEEEGRFEEVHALLFLMQDSLGAVSWSTLAARVGIPDTIAFSACLVRTNTQSRIDSDLAAARAVHAIGTPTILVNGLEYIGSPRDLARIVRYVRGHAARVR